MTEFKIMPMRLGRKVPRNCGSKLWAKFDVLVDDIFRVNNCEIVERPDGKIAVRPPFTMTSIGNVRAVKFTPANYVEFHDAAMAAYWGEVGEEPVDAGLRRVIGETLEDALRQVAA